MAKPKAPDDNSVEVEEEQPFLTHLFELRKRLLASLACVLLVFLGLAYFSNDIYTFLAQPLMKHLPQGSTMIATAVASPFLVPFKLTMFVALAISIPFVLYQIWGFVAPGLYRHERRLVAPLVVASTVLFFVGVSFAYWAVFPVVFGFFTSVAPEGVQVMTDIGDYLDFVLMMFVAFGVAFEVPVLVILLIQTGVVSVNSLSNKRPYVIVGAFCIGAVLTPPDVISQTMMSIPLWLLFEAGVLLGRFVTRNDVDDEEATTEDASSAESDSSA